MHNEVSIKKNSLFYRARINDYGISEPFCVKNMGAPPHDKIKSGGRINPPGISYLYLSKSIDTCIAEVNPMVGDYVSVATVNINQDLRIFNLDTTAIGDEWIDVELALDMSYHFSSPVNNNSKEIEYVPTQYLSELARSNGFDGIMHNSNRRISDEGSSKNLILFNTALATIESVETRRILGVTFSHTDRIVSYPPVYMKTL